MPDSVLPSRGYTNVGHVSIIGYLIAAGVALVLLPVLPFLVILWLLGQYRSPEAEPEAETELAEAEAEAEPEPGAEPAETA